MWNQFLGYIHTDEVILPKISRHHAGEAADRVRSKRYSRMQAEGAKEASVTLGLLCADVKIRSFLPWLKDSPAERAITYMPLVWKMDVKTGQGFLPGSAATRI